MGLLLDDSQFQKLESIFNDLNNSRGSDYSATSICQLSDILFEESTVSSNKCSCSPKDNNTEATNDSENLLSPLCRKEETFSPCQEKALLIQAGFSACIRAFVFEGFASQTAVTRVIRILRRLTRGVSQANVDCVLHREMLRGLGVIFGMVPDFNLLRVLQAPLKEYLFWCYTQSEDEYVVRNSRILLCATTWMREVASNNKNTSQNIGTDIGSSNNKRAARGQAASSFNGSCSNSTAVSRHGLTQSSQELLSFLISDLGICTEQLQMESRHSSSPSLGGSSNLELKKRVLRNLQLFSKLIIYSGVYHQPNSNPSNSLSSSKCWDLGSAGRNKTGGGSLITTLITPQIMQVLGNLRVTILEEVYRFVDEFVSVYLETAEEDGREKKRLRDSTNRGEAQTKIKAKSSPHSPSATTASSLEDEDLSRVSSDSLTKDVQARMLTCLIHKVFVMRTTSKESNNNPENLNTQLDTAGTDNLRYILDLAALQQEIFENLLEVSGKTGLVVYSYMIQEYLVSVFSLEQAPLSSSRLRNPQVTQLLFENFSSSLLFGFGLVPDTKFSDFDFEIFLSFKASLKAVEYFERLFQEAASIQELSIQQQSSGSRPEGSHHPPKLASQFSAFKDVEVARSINQRLVSEMQTYRLANNIILGHRYTRAAKEFRQREQQPSSLDGQINRCHVSSSRLLLNMISKNCQPFSLRSLGTHELIHSDTETKKILLELIYLVSSTIAEYYQDPETVPNPLVFDNINKVLADLSFILDNNFRDERLESTIKLFSSKVNNNNQHQHHQSQSVSPPDFKQGALNSDFFLHTIVCDFSKKDQFHLDYKDEDLVAYQSVKESEPSFPCLPSQDHASSPPSLPQSPLLQGKEPNSLIITPTDKTPEEEKKSPNIDDPVDLCMNLVPSSGEEDEEPSYPFGTTL